MRIVLIILLLVTTIHAQETKKNRIENKRYSLLLKSLLRHNVPELSIKDFNSQKNSYIILDTREWKEFEISHLEGARYVGYEKFDPNTVKNIDKSSKIVCYCSVGYRSEKIAKKLIDMGYTNVSNLYGSIFEWVNCDLPIVDHNNLPTNKLHAFSKKWGSFISNKNIQKVY